MMYLKWFLLKTDSLLETTFEKKSLITFWADVREEYSELSYKALNVHEHGIGKEGFFVLHVH